MFVTWDEIEKYIILLIFAITQSAFFRTNSLQSYFDGDGHNWLP